MRHARVLLVCAAVAAFLAAAGNSAAAKSPQVTWHHKCIAKFGFCADFPYITGADGGFEYNRFDSGTAASGKLDDFGAYVWHDKTRTHYCTKKFEICQYTDVYFVSVIKSKYTDPWTALTALNGGVKNAHRISVQGNLAARFTGLYGPVAISIYHNGLVYYLEAAVLNPGVSHTAAPFAARFLSSIRFK